jgi:chromosome partitioning protein
MFATISVVRAKANPALVLAGVVVNKWRTDRIDQRGWTDELTAMWGDQLIPAALPERQIISTIPTRKAPVPQQQANKDIDAAITAVIDRLNERNTNG